ncbi:MAG TPA: extracellular solute-binding protein [Actinophytocola sp.]|uniref:ABC transporter substrate-binding protein n=1 Tax=Actinophytocola sp. TaxID=1872138 RepID=UPI002DDD4486|nr:extracellular solute-binding protein [Actinophytocola sp.]HEV2783182.1 extracellular solute-binding protein [Actinophytocola sp.]
MQRRNRSGGMVGALASAVLLAAAACGSGSDGGGGGGSGGPVTIRFEWWGNPDRAKVTEQAIDLFEQKNADIKVETSFAEFNAYFQKLATSIAGGNAPDVLQMDYRYVREYGDRGVLADLREAKVETSGVTQQLLSGGTVGGKLYGIPPTQNTQVFSYDFAQWDKSGAAAPKDGWTWNDLKTSAQKVSDSTGRQVSGVGDFGGIEDWFEVWLRQQGKSLYTEDGKLGYTAADVARWWEMTDGWRRSGASTPAELTTKMDGSQANDPVFQKRASGGFGYDSGFTPQSWELLGRELKLSPFPSDTGKLGQYAKPAMMFSIAQRSEHKEAAAKLINFLIGDQEAGKILGMSRGLPANQQVRDQVGGTLQGPPKVAFEYEKAIGPKLEPAPPPPPKGAGEAKAAFQRVYDDVIFERGSIQENAQKLVDQATQAISS